MKTQVSIFEVAEKHGNSGKTYWLAKTNLGKVGIWNKALYDNLIATNAIGKLCEIEMEENGQYKNMNAFYSVIGNATEKPEFTKNQESKDASMMTSYAKDLVVAAINRVSSDEEVTIDEIDKMMEVAAKSISKAYKTIRAETKN